MKKFKLGDAVIEEGTNLVGIVVKDCRVTFDDQDGARHYWDYEVLYENNEIAYADDEDLMTPAQLERVTMRFSDGMEFYTSGPLRVEHRKDGYYVVGNGMLVPVTDRDEAADFIRQFAKTYQVNPPAQDDATNCTMSDSEYNKGKRKNEKQT